MAKLLLIIIYFAFISLGVPDSITGVSWPKIYVEFGVPITYGGLLFMIISAGTIVSSFLSGWVVRRLGTGLVTLSSVSMTAAALVGFAFSPSF